MSAETQFIKDPVKAILPWLGALGHTVVVIERDESAGNLYGGWRQIVEASSLADVQDMLKPGRRVFQKVGKRGKYGAVMETWRDVTPGIESWPQTFEEAKKAETCFVCNRPAPRISANSGSRGFKSGLCHNCRPLCVQPELMAHRRESHKQAVLLNPPSAKTVS